MFGKVIQTLKGNADGVDDAQSSSPADPPIGPAAAPNPAGVEGRDTVSADTNKTPEQIQRDLEALKQFGEEIRDVPEEYAVQGSGSTGGKTKYRSAMQIKNPFRGV